MLYLKQLHILPADYGMENVEPQDYTTPLLVLGMWEDSKLGPNLAYGGVTLRVTDFLLAPLMVSKSLLKRASDAGTISACYLEVGPSSLSECLVVAQEI